MDGNFGASRTNAASGEGATPPRPQNPLQAQDEQSGAGAADAGQQADPMQQIMQVIQQIISMFMGLFGGGQAQGGDQGGAPGGDAAGAPGGAAPGGANAAAPGGANAAAAPTGVTGQNPVGDAGAQGTTQGGVPFISQYNPNGADGGYTNGAANCGPTSVAMIARAFGKGGDLSDAQLINKLGQAGGTTAEGSSINGIVAMANEVGLKAETHGPHADIGWIDQQLAAGKKICANGDYYAEPGHDGGGRQSGHFLVVAGKDSNGNYLIQDPADGKERSMTAQELTKFMNSNPINGGYAVSIGK